MDNDVHLTSKIETEHYVFQLKATFRRFKETFTSILLTVGELPYQSLSITLPFVMKNNYTPDHEKTIGHLAHIKKFRESLLYPVDDSIWEKYSFPSEMLKAVFNVMRTEFPHIKHITLSDDSQLPCSSNPLDKLDLLYYYTAVHGESWYESEFGAYFIPQTNYIKYKCDVNYYKTKAKQNTKFIHLFELIQLKGSPTIYNKLKQNYDQYELMYESTNSYPEFLNKMMNTFDRSEKCYLFKGWIEPFLENIIGKIPREWIIDMYQAEKHNSTKKNRYVRRRNTRKRK